MAWFDYARGLGAAAGQGLQQFGQLRQQGQQQQRQRMLDVLALREKQRELLKEQWAQTLPGQEFTKEEMETFLPIVGKSAFEATKGGGGRRRVTAAEQLQANKARREQQQMLAQEEMQKPEFSTLPPQEQLRIAAIASGEVKGYLSPEAAKLGYEQSPEGLAAAAKSAADIKRDERAAAAQAALQVRLERLRQDREAARQRYELMGKSVDAAMQYQREINRINTQTASAMTTAWSRAQVSSPTPAAMKSQFKDFLSMLGSGGAGEPADDTANYIVVGK